MGSTLRKSSIMKLLLVIAALCSVAYCRRERVVGGSDVQPVGKWPWQGSLQFRSSGSHTCGSSLIMLLTLSQLPIVSVTPPPATALFSVSTIVPPDVRVVPRTTTSLLSEGTRSLPWTAAVDSPMM